ncbi:ribonuclease J [Eubacterium sp.]|uniref:ribonuclease J n=1 Tax=Eubacterium sp. TaxID=142586 RepID=UPI0026008E3C|nr:ribonuclease J [Eubacterium sp.]MDD7331736.1 ribonuclease J [Eubacterium sp.]MDY3812378.1 ribonuclease J [Eubacterium sp.]MDY5242575.1 ribonuclease J [Eubacterium sp.]
MTNTNKVSQKNGERKRNSKRRYYTYKKTPKKSALQPPQEKERVRISFLGGINEIGKNMTVYEYKNDMFIVDCGLAFPTAELPGVDLVIPDFTYIKNCRERIRGIIITHGHEDHIGGLAYLLKQVNIPVYATKLTIGLIKGKLEEHGLLGSVKLVEIKPRDNITLGSFNIELIHVNHSIPDAVGLAIRCPAGIIIQTGDFKIDTTPVDGDMIDLPRFAEYGKKGVLALLSDSTNAERPGYTMSERNVGDSFEKLFAKAKHKRIIVATFASNIHRVQQIIDVAQTRGRKVAVIGRSLENLVKVGEELGYLIVPKNILIPIDSIGSYSDDKLVIITTGSQGEPMSALTKMAFGDHRKVSITPNDYVIISATPIPGNEKMVGNVVNALMKRKVEVIYEKMYEVHVSGHACQEDLKLMMGIVNPKYFIPVHGEQKHLVKHAGLAETMGIPKDNIYIPDIAETVELTEDYIKKVGTVPAGDIYVDGLGVGDVGNIVLNDRKRLSQDGIIIVVATIDSHDGYVVSGPDIVSRGFVYVKDNEELMNAARDLACRVIDEQYDSRYNDWNSVKTKIRDEVSRLMYEKTKRSPMILPIFMEI